MISCLSVKKTAFTLSNLEARTAIFFASRGPLSSFKKLLIQSSVNMEDDRQTAYFLSPNNPGPENLISKGSKTLLKNLC